MNWNDPDEFEHKLDLCSDFEPDEDEEEDDDDLSDSEDDDDEIEEEDELKCLLRYNLVINAKSCGEMMDSVKLHERTCAACGRVELGTVVAIIPEAA